MKPWIRLKTSTSARGGKGLTAAPRTSLKPGQGRGPAMVRRWARTLRAAFGDWSKTWLPLSQLPPGELRIDGRRVSQLAPVLQGDPGPRSAFGQEVLPTGSKPGAQCPHAGYGPDRSHDGAGTGQCHR